MTEPINENARALSKLGASKGGRARVSSTTPEQRSEIARKAVLTRWKKAGKVITTDATSESLGDQPKSLAPMGTLGEPTMPYALFSGVVKIGGAEIPCHVLNDGRRVLHQRAMVQALGMARGGSSRGGGDRLAFFVGQKTLKPFVSDALYKVTGNPVVFKTLRRQSAYSYEADVLGDICEAVLAARQAGTLQPQQVHIAEQCVILMRGFARVGITALVDEATGYDKVKKKQDLQIKLQAFIAEEMQEWARMFPEEFWFELARLESVHYSPHSRPLRWGKYVMMFVYDAIDADVGRELRKKNPNPHFLQNHHMWLKKYGRDQVTIQIERVITIMKLCHDMDDFKAKFSHVFKKTPLQMSFADIAWGVPIPLRNSKTRA
ncbi:MAG: P63C domain-containing protein [Dehalococcoidia bacterium]|nr:P63C domain-containing protein [Dehalococcoidia bacterium]